MNLDMLRERELEGGWVGFGRGSEGRMDDRERLGLKLEFDRDGGLVDDEGRLEDDGFGRVEDPMEEGKRMLRGYRVALSSEMGILTLRRLVRHSMPSTLEA